MSEFNKDHLIEIIKKQIKGLKLKPKAEKIGTIIEVGDGIARLDGLTECQYLEMIEFSNNLFGVALNLEEGVVGAIVLGDDKNLKEGDIVKSTGRVLQVPVGENLVGRVINPLGQPLDESPEIKTKDFYPIEKVAPGVITRESVNTPLQTGIKSIDSMIPIGRGQRELIIGDRQTGKTALAVDTIINQRNTGVICIYVAIGQKKSKIAKIVSELNKYGAMKHTILVLTSAADPAALTYIAPYAGCAMGEYFLNNGKDALVIYDDLLKHAWAYREVSLLLRRPPGREAYPGDIFYLHSRLLERAAKLNKNYGGGSLTALPIIETQAGDITAYIPTNVISITDGQIYLESDLFYRGFRPALNVGLSVSRVGSKAQIKAMKQVAGKLRLDLAQFRELEAFAQFSSELDEITRKQLKRGQVLTEILKQEQYQPIPVEEQVVILYAGVNGYLDELNLEKVKDWEKGFINFCKTDKRKILKRIKEKKEITPEIEKSLKEIIKGYTKTFTME